MKLYKRLSTLILAVAMVLTLLPAMPLTANAAASGSAGNNATWTVDDAGTTLTISGTGPITNWYSNPAWKKHTGIKKVIIEDGITHIGNRSFLYLTELISIDIPESVTSIGELAFGFCNGLKAITIPESVTTIGPKAFNNCTSLTTVTIPKNVTQIGEQAFDGCAKLTGIWVDENNPNYSSDSHGILFNKNKTTLVRAYKALSGNYTIPNGVTTIGKYSFNGCTELNAVAIPSSVSSIEDYAFWNCFGLKTATIPSGASSIGPSAFSGCRNLETITIPNTVQTVGQYAFYDCDSLTNVTIPGSVTTIGNSMFYGCGSLTDVRILDGVTTIGNSAFCYCNSLASVTIPDTVASINANAFANCTNITDVYYDGTQAQWDAIDIGSGNEYLTGATLHCIIVDSGTCGANLTWTLDDKGTLAISGTGPMGNYATYSPAPWNSYRESIKKILIGNGITTLGRQAFRHCQNVPSIIIPDSVTSIGEEAFYMCSNLVSVNIPNKVTSIGRYAFYYCRFNSITIPISVNTIYNRAFSNCYNLSNVYYEGTRDQWKKITIDADNSNLLNATLHVKPTVEVSSESGTQSFDYLTEAIQISDSGSIITVKANIQEDVTVSKNVSLDLNGFTITGNITATDGAVITLKDTSTDDYSAEDGYGKIIGSVEGVEAAKGYMMITENGETSFHRLNLDTVSVNTRPAKAGMYFGSQFGGDEVVKRNIVAYGTAMGAGKMPNFADRTYTRFYAENWKTGCDSKGNSNNLENGTILQNIMHKDYGYSANKYNANIKVYSQAYVELADGTRILGDVVCYNLRDVFEGTDTITGINQSWNTLTDVQKQPVLQMYGQFQDVMGSWNIPNIKAAAK